MGQSTSSQQSSGTSPPHPFARFRRWSRSHVITEEHGSASNTLAGETRRTRRHRPRSTNRLSRLLHSTSNEQSSPEGRSSRLQRARNSLTLDSSDMSRRDPLRWHPSILPAARYAALTAAEEDDEDGDNDNDDPTPPRQLTLPDIQVPDLGLDFVDLTTSVTGPAAARTPSSRRSSLRLPDRLTGLAGLADRLPSMRHSRTGGGIHPFLRRRRSLDRVRPGEDSTAFLSRLLSVAAATTAATLLEADVHDMPEARGTTIGGDEGTFDTFLQSLEDGRLASALRSGNQTGGASGEGDNAAAGHLPVNFFRMFRFGSGAPTQGNRAANADGGATDGRLVPVIIVGIRAVNHNTFHGSREHTSLPPFDLLPGFPPSPLEHGGGFLDGNAPRNSTRFSHRRRASVGGISSIPYDAQRHSRVPESRPRSMVSDSSSWPRPPPATPASPSLSNPTSTNTTPAATVPTSRRSSFAATPRRESIIRTTTTTTLETTTEETPLAPRTARQRRLSDPDYSRSAYAARRNGIVEPDHPPTQNSRSWIIYVLGGSYPEGHPILTTPSLYSDSPTYEDMMLLSALLGPVKPPVASEDDVAEAGGIYRIEPSAANAGALVATGLMNQDSILLMPDQRCLVCLCDFEKQEEARRLVKCGHLFHRECIDEVRRNCSECVTSAD